jgi:hypothetical protein
MSPKASLRRRVPSFQGQRYRPCLLAAPSFQGSLVPGFPRSRPIHGTCMAYSADGSVTPCPSEGLPSPRLRPRASDDALGVGFVCCIRVLVPPAVLRPGSVRRVDEAAIRPAAGGARGGRSGGGGVVLGPHRLRPGASLPCAPRKAGSKGAPLSCLAAAGLASALSLRPCPCCPALASVLCPPVPGPRCCSCRAHHAPGGGPARWWNP